MSSIGATELMIVLLIALLIFGGAKLPKLAKSLREAKDEFEGGKNEPTKGGPKESGPKELPVSDADDKVTLSKSELYALLAERELKAKRD